MSLRRDRDQGDGAAGAWRTQQEGVALFEVLAALFVMSLTVVGVAKLQIAALKLQKDAASRYLAVGLARELGELMEVNAVGALGGGYEYKSGRNTEVSAVDCAAVYCDPAQLAKYDILNWTARARQMLDVSDLSVERKAVGAESVLYRISLKWYAHGGAHALAAEAGAEVGSFAMTKLIRDAAQQ